MDFLVINCDGYQVLLERIQDDSQWHLIIGVFIGVVHRFDEWEPFDTPEQVRERIATYRLEEAQAFVERAKAKYAPQLMRLSKSNP